MKADSDSTPFTGAPFDGRRFRNLSLRAEHGPVDVLRWMLNRRRQPWPRLVQNAPPPRIVGRVDDGSIHAIHIGHSTVLLQVAGLNILTDPIWSMWAGPIPGVGVKRVCPPAVRFEDLPKIDVVLLSHNHYDHLDRPTLHALVRRDDPRIVTGLKVGRSVPSTRVVELDWWQGHAIGGEIQSHYVPAEHFSARGPFDRGATLWGGFVLETPAGTVYYAGDSGAGVHFAMIRKRFGPMTLSLIPIGAYEPRWFMSPVHIDPAEALEVSMTLESQVSLAIHFGAFPLADDGMEDPVRELSIALKGASASVRGTDFRVGKAGEPVIVRRTAS